MARWYPSLLQFAVGNPRPVELGAPTKNTVTVGRGAVLQVHPGAVTPYPFLQYMRKGVSQTHWCHETLLVLLVYIAPWECAA